MTELADSQRQGGGVLLKKGGSAPKKGGSGVRFFCWGDLEFKKKKIANGAF